MHNPENIVVDIGEQREWLRAHKDAKGLSYSQLALQMGMKAGTISQFVLGIYPGRNDLLAEKVFKFRQLLSSQADRAVGLIEAPDYFETPTSSRIHSLLIVAHMGRITVGATGPGTGKTIAAREYAASVSNVWFATMRQTTKSVNAMVIEVLRAVGVAAKGGWGSQLSQLVADSVGGRRGLLIIDEANHLSWEALEEIRAWHDATGVGVCLLGNEELLMRIQGGPRRDAFARLNSRIAQSHIQNLPIEGDVEAFCDAWQIVEPAQRALLTRIALTPGAGGLRECKQIIEQASLLAGQDDQPLSLGHLKEAQSTRATKHIRS